MVDTDYLKKSVKEAKRQRDTAPSMPYGEDYKAHLKNKFRQLHSLEVVHLGELEMLIKKVEIGYCATA